MQVTKTPSPVQGEFIPAADITVNIDDRTFTRGFIVKQPDGTRNNFSGQISLSEIFAIMTPVERDAVKVFIKIGTRMAANAGIEPDTPLTDTDIGDEL